jgi:ATP-dependent DNA helicase RecG
MREKLTSLLQAGAEHGGTELELKYNDFFTATFRTRSQVTGQVGTKAESGAESKQVTGQVGTKSGLSRDQVVILRQCFSEKALAELLKVSGRSNRTKFRDQVLRPLIKRGWIEMTIPDKPRSSKQKYRLTVEGRALLQQEGYHE